MTTKTPIKISNVLWHVNQFEFRDWDRAIFQSYNSVCCVIDYKHSKITFWRDWDYSKTTVKHLLEFMRRFWNQTSKSIRKAIECWKLWYFKVVYDSELA
jgi:hypothetical protein